MQPAAFNLTLASVVRKLFSSLFYFSVWLLFPIVNAEWTPFKICATWVHPYFQKAEPPLPRVVTTLPSGSKYPGPQGVWNPHPPTPPLGAFWSFFICIFKSLIKCKSLNSKMIKFFNWNIYWEKYRFTCSCKEEYRRAWISFTPSPRMVPQAIAMDTIYQSY